MTVFRCPKCGYTTKPQPKAVKAMEHMCATDGGKKRTPLQPDTMDGR